VRIAIIHNQITPYRTEVFEALSARADCTLLVVYETDREPNRLWRTDMSVSFDVVLLRSLSLDLRRLASDAFLHIPLRPLLPLIEFRPDVVIAAGAGIWSSPANSLALLARRRYAWAFVPWWGSPPRPNPTLVRRLADPWVRAFMRAGDAWAVYGTRARDELIRLGADPNRTVIAPNAARRLPRAVSAGLSDGGAPRYLFVGQLIDRKGIRPLLDAFSSLERGELWIVGDGPLHRDVEAAAWRDPRIRMPGHLEPDELARLYASADVLVLPSLYEVWGLVVNEAMQFGLPVVVTDQVGAAVDLVVPEVTGAVVPAGSSDFLAEAMRRVGDWSATQRRRCAEVAYEKIDGWSPNDTAAGLWLASSLAVGHRAKSS
jgi:glycosyltransferase involved in cell wall biosynthesis